ncbi:MAG: sigma-70 family RNA polymerase sigma factor [Mucilaginibacter polytrichastri]|nr:sigma-70 family RNA polymerase sigma factor [Mucilaginibacter polytrichastri]
MVLQLIINNNGNEDDAKDIYQETIIVLYNRIKGGGFKLTSKLKTFIYSIARRLWLKKLNHASNQIVHVHDYQEYMHVDNELGEHNEKEKRFQQMFAAMNQMGEPCRTIIEDFYMHNRSMQEICEKFGYTNTDNAKTQKYKCLQRLKKLFFSTSESNHE